MDELTMLRKMVEEHDYEGAIAIISELDDMAKDDKINKIESFLLVLLIHLIKQHAEQRTTKSWNRSIDNSLGGITKSNKRRSAGGNYLRSEAFEGIYSTEQISKMIDAEQIKQEALDRILTYKLEQ